MKTDSKSMLRISVVAFGLLASPPSPLNAADQAAMMVPGRTNATTAKTEINQEEARFLELGRQVANAKPVTSTAASLAGIKDISVVHTYVSDEFSNSVSADKVDDLMIGSLKKAGIRVDEGASCKLQITLEGQQSGPVFGYKCEICVMENVTVARGGKYIVTPAKTWGKTLFGPVGENRMNDYLPGVVINRIQKFIDEYNSAN